MVNKKAQYISFNSTLHTSISGQNGLNASISSSSNNTSLIITGLTGMTAASVGNILTITNAANSNNNGSFLINGFISSTSVRIDNTIGVAPDSNNGLINWIEKLPYELENALGINDHSSIRDLIHFINEGPANGFSSGAYKEILPSGDPFPTSVIWYTDNTKSFKIVEKLITRNNNKMPISIVWNMYATNGINILHSITDTINYIDNVFESDRTRVIL